MEKDVVKIKKKNKSHIKQQTNKEKKLYIELGIRIYQVLE